MPKITQTSRHKQKIKLQFDDFKMAASNLAFSLCLASFNLLLCCLVLA